MLVVSESGPALSNRISKMNNSNSIKIVIVILLFAGAGYGFYRFFSKPTDISEKSFFYDLSEKKLFAASRELLPPICGLNDKEEDAVRAVVICIAGNPDDPANRKIAYLEKYTPELKENIEQTRHGVGESMKTKVRNKYRLVAHAEDNKWFSAETAEGQKIMNSWNVAGPDKKYPTVCSP